MTIATGRVLKCFILLFTVAFLLIIFDRWIFFMNYEEFPEPEFKVYGDNRVLSEMIINIESGLRSSPYIYLKNQTLLYKEEKQYIIQNEFVSFYKIYFSYGNKVGSLAFENLYGHSDGTRVNSIYVIKNAEGVHLEYYPVSDATRSGRRVSKIAVPIDEYFKENNILKNQQSAYLKKFNNFYEPTQTYKRQLLSESFIETFKQLPLALKKEYEIFPEDLEKIDLPEGEKKELIMHAENTKKKDNYSFY